MPLAISQIYAASFNAVVNDSRKPSQPWLQNSLMNKMQAMNMVNREDFGPQIEQTIDYRRNPGTDFLATDLTPTSMAKTEILTAAVYTPANLSVPVVWSKSDELQNPEKSQKVALVASLINNGLASHDDAIEEGLFATSTDGFLGFATLLPTSGQGNVGGIDASLETWWRNDSDTYAADGSDIEAVLTELWNTASKGSGSSMVVDLMFSGPDPHALFESTQVPQQRYIDTQDFKIGAKTLAFKTAGYIFSQYGGTKIYGVPSKGFKLKVSRKYFRDKGEIIPLESAEGWKTSIFSGLQLVTNAKSRGFVADQA